MGVLLRRRREIPSPDAYEAWVAIGDPPPGLDPARRVGDLGAALENAFDAIAADWWKLGRALSAEPTAVFGHTPACVANLSDFGLMLAWARLVADWARARHTTLVVTDDPWMFRHIAHLTGVEAGAAPRLWRSEARLFLRGYAARLHAALRFAGAALSLKSGRPGNRGGAAILVYGHPRSSAAGDDGYFGDLMRKLPGLQRMLHVDCPPARARELMRDGRTASLHGWGRPLAAARLVWAFWRPSAAWDRHPAGWLIRRAAKLEGGTAAGTAIGWQQHCQQRWLAAIRPATVAWPWENHAWERAFARQGRALRVRTIGYQHSVIGRHMLNYAPASNPDGTESLPDTVLCSGAATAQHLVDWQLPAERVTVGGAWRIADGRAPIFADDAPVFLPLPFDGRIAAEMIAAANAVPHRDFLVKQHPMSPHGFDETERLRGTDRALADMDRLSAVVYAASTVGLESLIAGLPTFRFRPRSGMALDILPQGVDAPAVDHDSLATALAAPRPGPKLDRCRFFGPVDIELWRGYLETGTGQVEDAEFA